MGACVGHEPCPKCGSRDNLARYDDGGAWCFGCHYWEPPTHFVPIGEDPVMDEVPLPQDCSTDIPEPNYGWLRQYLNDAEIKAWFKYSPMMQRHIFQWVSEPNQLGHSPCYWEARSVIATEHGYGFKYPKTLSYGEKPFMIIGPWRTTGKVVFVEDIVSAIKVARHAGAIPCFGSAISTFAILQVANKASIKDVSIWLDRDKYPEAMKAAERIGKFKYTRVISTEDDPKIQSDEDIRELLEL